CAAGKKWQDRRVDVGRRVSLVCTYLGVMLFGAALTQSTRAHIPGHEEWNNVLAGSTNQFYAPCCGLGDARLVEFDDWRPTKDGSYEVRLLGHWHGVERWKLTTNEANPTGKAIVWYVVEPRWEGDTAGIRVLIYCFKPLEAF